MKIRDKIVELLSGKLDINSIIAKFILDDVENFEKWSHKYFVEKTHCSKASVSRFFKSIGFDNFNHFYYDYKNEIHLKKELISNNAKKNFELTEAPKFLLNDLRNNFNNILLSLEELDFDYIKQLIITKRRVIIFINSIYYSLFSKMLMNLLVKQNNVQIINIEIFSENYINNFDDNDIFISIFAEKIDVKEFNIIKQINIRNISMINIIDFDDMLVEQNFKNYLIKIPLFKQRHNTFFLKMLYIEVMCYIFSNIF